jgi:PIN domain nuclease of toxin-antitoxin system
MRPLLLDTCAALWITEDEPVAPRAVAAMDAAHREGAPTYLSPITAWEVGLLSSRNRLNFVVTPQRWFQRLLEVPGVRLADLSPDLLIASSFLPGAPPRDPADRILAATARDPGATLITRDRALLAYGADGYISVVAC